MSKTLPGSEIADNPARHVTANMPSNAVSTKFGLLQNAILDRADVVIIATDAKGIIQVFNAGAERLLGYASSDVINKMATWEFHDPQELVAHAKRLSAEFATTITPGLGALAFKSSRGIEDEYDLDYVRKDGSRFPAHVSGDLATQPSIN